LGFFFKLFQFFGSNALIFWFYDFFEHTTFFLVLLFFTGMVYMVEERLVVFGSSSVIAVELAQFKE